MYDLLSHNLDEALPVREDAAKGIYVEGLSEFTVSNTSEAMEVLKSGMDNRKVASTNMNRVSSRSHALFVLNVRTEITQGGITKVRDAKFTLVDLAGSERQKTTDAAGERLKEASMINNSLLCLGQVINSLVDQQRGLMKHAPFRDSKLTFLLKSSFGGNSKTCLVATVTPSAQSLTETISTLKFAQRAKLIKNNAMLNEDAYGSVPALQAEIARLKAELAMRNDGQSASMGCASMPSQPTDVTVLALRHQNSKLSKTVTTLKEVTQQREAQVTSLKRKLQQETLIRKCKERRITNLSSKSDSRESQEIEALQEEVSALRDQLDNGRNTEAIDWMLKYKETQAKVDEMESESETLQAIGHQRELEETVVNLMNEKDALQAKLETVSADQNGELDAILKDVTQLEAALGEKTALAMQTEEKLRSSEVELSELQEEMKRAVEILEAAQSELSAEKSKSTELQESVEVMKKEVEQKSAAIEEYWEKMSAAEKEINQLNNLHSESTAALQSKIAELEKDVNLVMDENDSLMKKLKTTTEDVATMQTQLETLKREKEEMTEQEKLNLDAFKLKEEEFQFELKELNDKVAGLVRDKADAADKLQQIATENTTLLAEFETFKAANEQYQKQLEELRDTVADLEDELMVVSVERNCVEEQLEFSGADLERTVRFHQDHTSAIALEHDNELALRDEWINSLINEKSSLELELSSVNKQMDEAKTDHDQKLDVLQNEMVCMKEKCAAIEAITSELETAKEEHAKLLDYIAHHDKETEEKLSAMEKEKNELKQELESAQLSLKQSESTSSELAKSIVKVAELEVQIERLQTDRDQLAEETESLKAEVAFGEEAQRGLTELEARKEELEDQLNTIKLREASTAEEMECLKDKLSAVEKELESQKDNSALFHEQTESELTELQAEKERLQTECSILKSTEATANDEMSRLKETISQLEHDHSSLKNEAAAIEEKASKELTEMRTEKEQLTSECNDLKNNVASLTDEATSLKSMLDAMGKDFDSLKEDSTASKDQANTKLLELQAENDRLETELHAIKDQHVAKDQEIIALNEKLAQMEKAYQSLNEEHAASCEQSKSQLLELKAEKDRIESEFNTMKDIETSKNDLVASLQTKLNEMEKDYESLKIESTASREQAKSDFHELKAEKERLQMELDAVRSTEASTSQEMVSLKDKLASLEQEYEALKDESADKFKTTPPSPACDADLPQGNTMEYTFMDESFDEDMFLPNVDIPAKEEPSATLPSTPEPSAKVEQIDENQQPSPSKTPFQQRRALFSPKKTPSAATPLAQTTTAKKPAKRATRSSKTPVKTSPLKRVTRRSTRNTRTPLGNIND